MHESNAVLPRFLSAPMGGKFLVDSFSHAGSYNSSPSEGTLTNNATNYFAPLGNMSIGPGFVFEGDFYLSAGDSDVARQIIYRLHQNQAHPSSSRRLKLQTSLLPEPLSVGQRPLPVGPLPIW
jgi:hypothetical protein